MLSSFVASCHLLTLALGLGALVMRGFFLRAPLDDAGLRRLFIADNFWGAASLLWVATGLWRAFGGLEKGSHYYLHNHMFWLKMALFLVVLLLELAPMITFIRWRIALGHKRPINTGVAARFRRLNDAEVAVIVAMVFVAGMMARGIGYH